MRSFLDTNVLIYAVDEDVPRKKEAADRLIEEEALAGRAVLSTQVLQEFYVVSTRRLKRPLSPERAEQAVRALATLPIVQVDPRMILGATARGRRMSVSFWDALIIEAAVAGGATTLYTEDLQDGLEIDRLTIRNPFR
ncbi:PIN domain-containing protein [soil metagenome]